MTPELLVHDEGRVRTLTLNRPDRMNAMTRSLQRELGEAVVDAGLDPAVSVIVLTGAGERAFCAGVDLKEIQAGPPRAPYDSVARMVWEVVLGVGKPTVAALNGAAVGGGFELALACDMIVAATGVRVGLPEAKRGMGAVFGSVALPRRLPPGVAAELLYTGELVTIDELERWGFVQRLVEPADLRTAAAGFAAGIAANAPLSLRRIKEMGVKGASLPLAAATRLDAGPNPYGSQDVREGVQAFLERREPRWQGR
jgi:enoyl-CoA hydratase